jgi:hypothetical protein
MRELASTLKAVEHESGLAKTRQLRTVGTENIEHWDAFVSHAWEDKETFVRPLVEALGRLGVSLWYDEVSLKLGESLSGSIDRGIGKSRNGVVVVSPAFLQKKWPEAELHALMTRRIEGKLKLLPIWHNADKLDVAAFSPLLADLWALPTVGRTAQDVAIALLAEIRPDLYESMGRSQLERLATGEAFEELEKELRDLREKVSDLVCPTCEAPLVERIVARDDTDPNQMDIDVFECGYVRGGYYPQACPSDPTFPALTEYDLRCAATASGTWICWAVATTTAAKRHYLSGTDGLTAIEAKTRLIEKYNEGARPEKRVGRES